MSAAVGAAMLAAPTAEPPRSRRSRASRILLGLVIAALTASIMLWRFDGYLWFTVATPSMGRAAPVGTLLIVKVVHINQVHVGDIISFHPPGLMHTYTHRVVSIDASGGLHTRG